MFVIAVVVQQQQKTRYYVLKYPSRDPNLSTILHGYLKRTFLTMYHVQFETGENKLTFFKRNILKMAMVTSNLERYISN